MFKINYRIVESYERLKAMDAATYDKEWANIEGLIELKFRESSIGYMYYDEITVDMYEAGCFQDELLVSWFENLLDTVMALYKADYVTLREIECPYIIEFYKQSNHLIVRESREVFERFKTIPNMSLIDRLIFLSRKFKYTGRFKSSKGVKGTVTFEESDFKETTILQSEFELEVLVKAEQFIDEVASQFPWLMKSRTFLRLRDKVENVRQLVKK